MIPIVEFNNLVRPLLSMEVSLPWRGIGTAVFIELGELQPMSRPRQKGQDGEACVSSLWDWRIENEKKIICGSSNSRPKMENAIGSLKHLKIKAITIDGRIPELTVHFSNGKLLRSIAMASGDPQWNIRLQDGTWLFCENGNLIHNNGEASGSSPEEDEIMEYCYATAKRWGAPIVEPLVGNCQGCVDVVRIDGEYSLLEYGVCTAADSPLDGRAVNYSSGCPAFTADSISK